MRRFMADQDEAFAPHEVADYLADFSAQLAAMAQSAGLHQTALHLTRAQVSALSELREVQKAAPEDAA